jgi:hypothetical protein
MRIDAPMLTILSCLHLTAAAHAVSFTVSDKSSKQPGLARDTIAMLVDAGLRLSGSGGKFTIEAQGLHCDQRSNAPVDAADPHAGLPTLKCRIGAKNERDTTSGQPFAEGRAMTDILEKIQNAADNGGVAFNDCAMGGYCGTFVRTIRCTIDTHVENLNNGGRYACTFTDGQ